MGTKSERLAFPALHRISAPWRHGHTTQNNAYEALIDQDSEPQLGAAKELTVVYSTALFAFTSGC